MNLVAEVEPNSPFDRSGIKLNDVILKVNEQNVFGERLPKIMNLIENSYKNGFVRLDVSEFLPSKQIVKKFDPKQPRIISIDRKGKYEYLGFEFEFIYSEKRYEARNVRPNLPAYKAGLRNNDKILQINGDQIYLLEKNQVDEIIDSLGREIDLLVIADLEEYNRIVEKNSKGKKNSNFNLEDERLGKKKNFKDKKIKFNSFKISFYNFEKYSC